jgi:methionyl aminopeptidase
MREGGKIASLVLSEIRKSAKPGVVLVDLDSLAEKIIRENGAKPSFKGFKGYPTATCVSVNSELVHGIPDKRKLNEGDIVGVDVGVYYKGFHTDTAITIGIGKISIEAQKLLNITQESLFMGLKKVKAGVHLGDVQETIQTYIEKAGFSVIRNLTGHGVGKELQEEPSIPNFGKSGTGIILKEGMTLAIEPMVAVGSWEVRVKPDGWTVVMADGSLGAHFEHTIVVTKSGCEILTK